MRWSAITTPQSEDSWLHDYVTHVLTHEPLQLPAHEQRIGHVECVWHEIAPGHVYVAANPNDGTIIDRLFAERVLYQQLLPFGFKRAHLTAGFEVNAAGSWGVSDKVHEKAVRLVQNGAVHLDRNGQDAVVAHVDGEGTDNNGTPDVHQVEIRRQDPSNPQKVTGAFCDCDWGQFLNTPRTREWKRFQRVPCAHIVATSWVASAVPGDEERAPGNLGQPGQMTLPGMDQSGGQAPSTMPMMQPQQQAPGQQFQQPSLMDQVPPPEDVLPQFPMDPSMQPTLPQVNPASVPGGRPGPTPTNPLQYPGGTFSSYGRIQHVAQQTYQNGQVVDLLQDTQGTQVGRSEAHGAGQTIQIPAGRSGEVLGTDPTTGMVEVLFMDKDFDTNTVFEPFGARVWCWPSEVRPSRKRPPGPAYRR